MAIQSNYLEGAVADAILSRSIAIPTPGTLYFALFLALPDENGLNGIEVSTANGTGYSRKAVANSVAEFPPTPVFTRGLEEKGVKCNVSAGSGSITFPPAQTDWGDVVGFGIFDAATGGNLLISSPLDTLRTVAKNDTMRFVDRELKFTQFGQQPDNILSFFMQRVVMDSLFGRVASYSTQSVTDVYFSLFTKVPQADESGFGVTVDCDLGADRHRLTMTSTTGLTPGMLVSGSGVPAGALIDEIVSGTEVKLALPDGLLLAIDVGPNITFATAANAASFEGGVEVGGQCTLPCCLTVPAATKDFGLAKPIDATPIAAGMKVSCATPGILAPDTIVKDVTGNVIQLSPGPLVNAAAALLTFSEDRTGYSRVKVANTAANFPPYANGVKTNATQVVWGSCKTPWSSVCGLGIHDAASGGNLLFKIPFASIRNFVAGEQPRLASNALSIYLD